MERDHAIRKDRFFVHLRKRSTSALDVIDATLGFAMVLCITGIIVDVTAGVVSRYVFNASFRWTEELGQVLFIWMIFIGLLRAHRHRRHMGVGVLNSVSGSMKSFLAFIKDFLVVYVSIFLVYGGWNVTVSIGGVSAGLGWPQAIWYIIIPITGLISLAYLILRDIEEDPRRLPASVGSVVLGAIVFYFTTFSGLIQIPETSASVIMGITFLVALVVGTPVAFAMLLSVFLATWGADLLPPAAVAQNMVVGAGKFVLLAIPLFLCAGYLMNIGGLTTRLMNLAHSLVGHFYGGLAQVNVMTSLLIGGISGSSSADAAGTSKMLVPEMIRNGYSAPFSCAVTASSAILPNIIPPSIAMLIFASIAQASIGRLFLAGVLPGILLAGALMGCVYIISKRKGYGQVSKSFSVKVFLRCLKDAAPVLVLPFMIIGGIRFGVVTATEAGAVAILWAVFLGKFVYRAYTWRELYTNLRDAAGDAAVVGFLLAVAAPFSWILIAERLPQMLLEEALRLVSSPYTMLFALNLLLLFAGTFFDLTAAILVVVPLILPIIVQYGVDPIHFGIIVIVNLMLGSVTPPVGLLVFVTASVTGTRPNDVFKAVVPFLFAMIAGLLVITYVPAVSLLLPDLLW